MAENRRLSTAEKSKRQISHILKLAILRSSFSDKYLILWWNSLFCGYMSKFGVKFSILRSNFDDDIFWPRKIDFKEKTICQRIYTAGDGEVSLAAAFSLSTSSFGWLLADDWLINKYAKDTRIEWSNGTDGNVCQLALLKRAPF